MEDEDCHAVCCVEPAVPQQGVWHWFSAMHAFATVTHPPKPDVLKLEAPLLIHDLQKILNTPGISVVGRMSNLYVPLPVRLA